MSALQRQCEARRAVPHNVAFLVPPYNAGRVFLPSYAAAEDEAARDAAAVAATASFAARGGTYAELGLPPFETDRWVGG